MRNKITFFILILFLFGQNTPSFGQDGEQLFKQCNTCHLLGKNSTGPNLKGVRQKWEDAGELELIYDWVKNPGELIASGKSTMAAKVETFSPTQMAPQNVTKEETNAIFDYIDNYEPPVEVTTTETGEKTVVFVPNYEENLTLFYWLTIALIVLLIAILMMAGSIRLMIKSDYFKKKLIEKENGSSNITTIIVLLVVSSLMTTNSFGFTFNQPGEATEGQPWLLIENSDLYFLAVIDILLLGVVFYLRSMFNEFMRMIKKPVVEVPQEKITTKINAVLNDFVPIEEEHKILLHHEYDGIRELDNNLPPWWLWGFYATIVFAIIYIFNYHILGTSDLQIAEYEKDMAQKKIEVEAYLKKMALNVDETSATLMEDASDLNAGQSLFETNCATCHLVDGTGKIGPNLTDAYWIYGNDVKDLFKTIKYGTSNGMPEHNSKLNPVQIQQVASFVLHFKPKDGKEPEGTLIEAKKE